MAPSGLLVAGASFAAFRGLHWGLRLLPTRRSAAQDCCCRVPSDGHPPDSWPPALVLWLYLWIISWPMELTCCGTRSWGRPGTFSVTIWWKISPELTAANPLFAEEDWP
ncbi:TLC domain-containing protein 2 isoform X2 [Equus przewalskii]|uniref:TLC domain-containing protein 2 isoform X2 n=1 Tax=Equus przewalskii TaxID=9798 RepID=A0ABM4JSS8_EQUPR